VTEGEAIDVVAVATIDVEMSAGVDLDAKEQSLSLPEVKIYAAPGARVPERATPGSAGLDVRALTGIDTIITIPPGKRMAIPTGLYFEIPEGYFVTLRPRSGLALKHGLTLINTPATIDSDYRGELQVIMGNIGHEPVTIENGDRIAQLFLEKVNEFRFQQVETRGQLSGTDRGEGGFGSTGSGSADHILA
jgi:dUTP pyrophosphatase